MSTSRTIARIAESGFVWDVFRNSRLYSRSSMEEGTIGGAIALLDRELEKLPNEHRDRDRKVKAKERLLSAFRKGAELNLLGDSTGHNLCARQRSAEKLPKPC